MKITFILPIIGVVGGVRIVFEYAKGLQERGHEINIVYPLMPLQIKPKFNPKDVVGQILGTLSNLKRNGNEVKLFNLKTKLIRIISLSPKFIRLLENKIPDSDIIIATSWETVYSINKLNEKKGKKFYLVQHYEIWDLWNDEECWKEAEKIDNKSDKLCLAMFDIIPKDRELRDFKNLVDQTYKMPLKKITVSSWLKELIDTKFYEKTEAMIINRVNFDIFYKEGNGCKSKKLRILMPYRPNKWKGTEDGLEAFKLVKKIYPNIEFVMYGAKRRKEIPEWIKFYERISDMELRRLYNSSDIFVYPSWTEGFGLPPLEAMACGCAVVATNVGGIPDYAINEETILASPPRNPKILAHNIIKLIENEDERKKIAENGYNYVKQFTMNKAIDDLERILVESCIV